jgi:hypothetical protein
MNPLGQTYALLRVQFQSVWNTLKRGDGRRGLLLSLSVSLIWHGLWIAAAVGSAIIPSFVGFGEIEKALPGLLFMVMAYWQLAPLLTMSLGVSLQMRNVAIYPISTGTLFAIECLLRLGTGSEMVLLLCGLFIGLSRAGSPHTLELALAFTLFLAFNVLLSAGIRTSVERIVKRRKLREVLVILLVSSTVLPQLLVWSESARHFTYALLETTRSVPYWVLPSSLAGRVGAAAATSGDIWLLIGMTIAAGVFGYSQFRRSIRPDGLFAGPNTAASNRWRLYC